MDVILRAEPGPGPKDPLYVHMGAGQAREEFVRAMVVRYDLYRGVHPGRPDRGALAISVFAEVRGVTRAEIIAAMRHNQYGVAHRSDLRAGVIDIWPTTITGTDVNERVMSVHYDLILDDTGFVLPGPSAGLSDTEVGEAAAAVRERVAETLAAFEPRIDKRTGRPASKGAE